MGGMKQVSYSGPAKARRHRTNFIRPGSLATGICAPVRKSNCLIMFSGYEMLIIMNHKYIPLAHCRAFVRK